MAVETQTVALTTQPVDLAAVADVAAALAALPDDGTLRIAFQNVAVGKTVCYADTAVAPAAGSRDGFLLRYGDGVVYELEAGDALWVWSTTTATLALTGAA